MTSGSAQTLFWIALGALFVPLISRRLRLPSAVGELVYGMIFGPYLLNIITRDDFIEFMAQLGFAILMFSAGMEIDFAPLRKRGSKLLGTAWLWTLLAAGASVAGVSLLKIDYWAALAVCSVSIGLASVLLKERDMLGEPIGQAILAVGLIGESLSIFLLAVLDIHHHTGFSFDFYRSVAHFTGIFILAYVLMRIFRFIIWWTPKKVAQFLDSEDPLELGVRLAVALLFIFLAAATLLGVEAILGAFIAGALYGFIFQEREVIADKISAMGQGFFVPFFFIVVGSHFDPLGSIRNFSAISFVKLIGLAVIVKMFPSFVLFRMKLGVRQVIASGLLLAAPLTLTVAVAQIAADLGVISADMLGMLILVAVVTGLLCPFLARSIIPTPKKET